MNSLVKKTSVALMLAVFILGGLTFPHPVQGQDSAFEGGILDDCAKANELGAIIGVLDVFGGIKQAATDEIIDFLGDLFGSGEEEFRNALEKNLDDFEKKAKEELSDQIKEGFDKTIGDLRDKALDEAGITSTDVPVKDSSVEEAVKEVTEAVKQAEVQRQKTEAAKKVCENKLKSVQERIKILLLDHVTNQIIDWITNDRQPKMITDWWGFFRDVRDEAAGTVIQELAPQLCSPFRTQVLISLQQPVFTHQVSCTLDQVVGNIENFYDDFSSGGWLGYQTIWKPQNNYYGALILAQDEMLARAAQQEEAAAREAQANRGFQSTKICETWSLTDLATGAVVLTRGSTNDDTEPTDFPPGYDDNNSLWLCEQERVVTPGLIAAEQTVKAVNKDIDAIQNASDLEPYITAIVDAFINRFTREAVDGVRSWFK